MSTKPIRIISGILRYIIFIFGKKIFDDNYMRGYALGKMVAYRYKAPK